jgi:hypothetical protein
MAHRATHDLAQHVSAKLIRGDDTVRDQERHRPGVIRQHAHRDVGWRHGAAMLHAGPFADGGEQRREQVRVVVRQVPLQYGGDALEAHPGVDGRRRQRLQDAVGLSIELHEHVVPDFDVAIAAALEATARAAGRLLGARNVLAAVVVNLRAAAAGAGIAHLPEVVGGAQLPDPFGRQHRLPDAIRLVVPRNPGLALEDRRVQPVGRQLPRIGQQAPGKRDGVLLEVIAEREIPKHLEERVVAERRSHIVEVVVLAADAHALLRGGRTRVAAPLAAKEHVLELVHPGVREQQRRVLVRDERRTRDDLVLVPLEVL